jgi:hypothetical protein
VVSCGQDELCRPTDGQCVESCNGEVCACANGETKPCANVGTCSNGERTCTSGVFGACQWQQGPTPEDCDGLDNDCNGVVDDSAAIPAPACALEAGVCGGAVQACGGTQGWLPCNGAVYLQHASAHGNTYQVTEAACDGEDNDCDGDTDEPAQCCVPTCSGAVCGANDGCGGTCDQGSCGVNQSCGLGSCECAFVTCGGTCCSEGQVCSANACVAGPTPSWQQLTPITSRSLRGVWGTSASNIWAVGDGGTVLHYNGSQWSAVTSNTALHLRDVWGSSANDVWAVGDGVVIRWNGTQWSAAPTRENLTATSVWGTSPTNVYVSYSAPSFGAVDHFNGTTWSLEQSAGALFTSVSGSSASNVWAVGPVFVAPRRYNGTMWSTSATVVSYIRSVWVPSTNAAWGVGDSFGIKQFAGTAWQDVASPISGSNAMAASVWGRAADDVWAVGNTSSGNVAIAHYNGAGWQLGGPAATINQTAFDVWASSATNVWVVGSNGTILHYAPN